MPFPELPVREKTNGDRDYPYKRSEDAARSILKYWTIDPDQSKIIIFALVDDWFESQEFCGLDRIKSSVLPDFTLIAGTILNAGQ